MRQLFVPLSGLLSASLGLIEGTGLTDEVNQYEGVSQRYVGKQIVISLQVTCTHAVTLRETLATDIIWF